MFFKKKQSEEPLIGLPKPQESQPAPPPVAGSGYYQSLFASEVNPPPANVDFGFGSQNTNETTFSQTLPDNFSFAEEPAAVLSNFDDVPAPVLDSDTSTEEIQWVPPDQAQSFASPMPSAEAFEPTSYGQDSYQMPSENAFSVAAEEGFQLPPPMAEGYAPLPGTGSFPEFGADMPLPGLSLEGPSFETPSFSAEPEPMVYGPPPDLREPGGSPLPSPEMGFAPSTSADDDFALPMANFQDAGLYAAAESPGNFLDNVNEQLYPQDALSFNTTDYMAGEQAFEEASSILFPETVETPMSFGMEGGLTPDDPMSFSPPSIELGPSHQTWENTGLEDISAPPPETSDWFSSLPAEPATDIAWGVEPPALEVPQPEASPSFTSFLEPQAAEFQAPQPIDVPTSEGNHYPIGDTDDFGTAAAWQEPEWMEVTPGLSGLAAPGVFEPGLFGSDLSEAPLSSSDLQEPTLPEPVLSQPELQQEDDMLPEFQVPQFGLQESLAPEQGPAQAGFQEFTFSEPEFTPPKPEQSLEGMRIELTPAESDDEPSNLDWGPPSETQFSAELYGPPLEFEPAQALQPSEFELTFEPAETPIFSPPEEFTESTLEFIPPEEHQWQSAPEPDSFKASHQGVSAGVNPSEWRLENLEILGTHPLADDKQLLLVMNEAVVALMGYIGPQDNPQITVLKIFDNNPLAENAVFGARLEGSEAGNQLFLTQVGNWQAIISVVNNQLIVHTELV